MGVEYGQVNNYAKYGQPTLDLVFTGPKKSLNDRVGNVAVEFSRTQDTQASYVKSDGTIGYASTDVPRFDHDPVTGESLGLLIEESRTNNALNSENTSLWNNFRITTGTDTIVAPDGISKPVYYIQNTSTVDSIARNGTASTNSGNSSSVFLKARSGSTWVAVGPGQYAQGYNGYNVYVNLADGSIGTVGNQLTYSSIKVTEFPNDWYRVEINNHNNQLTTSNQALWVAVVEGDGTRGTPSGGTHSYYVWGGQFEDGSSSVSSYIPTSGSTSTRGADTASITGAGFSSWYNGSEGSMFIDMKRPAVGALAGESGAYLEFFNNSGYFLQDISSDFVLRIGGENNTVTLGQYATTTDYKIASSYQSATDFNTSSNGSTPVSNSTSKNFNNATELHIGRGNNAFASNWRNGTAPCHFSRLTYWPTRLSDSDLQSLTE